MIETRDLRKSFTTRQGGVRLTMDEGEISDFLGPNGAGKTTTLRILATRLYGTRHPAVRNEQSGRPLPSRPDPFQLRPQRVRIR
ncbi:ATP-binding cassette domain-containing protein [Actinoplanes sp. TFC3]|uniref:ATP-binding cassette domain-containing protein n=1 Tax=Actinoplanes sp. TFC3 TaxID=1710355 RepID=UPI000834B6E2|nr:ATP-binding cassette domain-containing protein [Actinoplanes sp. TFC3]